MPNLGFYYPNQSGREGEKLGVLPEDVEGVAGVRRDRIARRRLDVRRRIRRRRRPRRRHGLCFSWEPSLRIAWGAIHGRRWRIAKEVRAVAQPHHRPPAGGDLPAAVAVRGQGRVQIENRGEARRGVEKQVGSSARLDLVNPFGIVGPGY